MQNNLSTTKEAWKTILIFLAIVTITSSIFHYAIVNFYPSRMYIGGLMWCPALATIITLKIQGKSIFSLQWNLGSWKFIRKSYFIPALYVFVTYLLIWLFNFGDFLNEKVIANWSKELGLEGFSSTWVLIIAIFLTGTVEVLRSMATTLGEEIGWRGFFIYELRKVFSFTGVSIFSGIVWATWHWPLIVYYGGNVALEMTTFFIVIISMSFIITYYTFKSNSLWPSVLFHAVSNVYIQKIFPKLTTKTEGAEYWLGESGIMFAIVTFLFGIYFLRKAIKESI